MRGIGGSVFTEPLVAAATDALCSALGCAPPGGGGGADGAAAATGGSESCLSLAAVASEMAASPPDDFSVARAKVVAQAAGLTLGGAGYAFEGTYATKGLYTYSSGGCFGMAFFGTGGTIADMRGPCSKPTMRRIAGWGEGTI